MIDLSLLISKNKTFTLVGVPDFEEGQVENRAKTGKCSISQSFEGISYLSMNSRELLISPF